MDKAYPVISSDDCTGLTPKEAKGKLVVCGSDGGDITLVTIDGAVGYVSLSDKDQSVLFYQTNVSNTAVNSNLTNELFGYINSTK
jgi:hypothetical protein